MSFRILPNPPFGPMPPVAERADPVAPAVVDAIVEAPGVAALRQRLALPGALTVTTGQQPALFLGPLYSLHKAISAASVARLLEVRWARPVVPVFWVAGDDHDWDEARTAHWLDDKGEVTTASLPERDPGASMTPLWREPLGAQVTRALASFRRTHPESATAAPVLDLLERHFLPDATVAAATAGMLAELLAPLGILVLDSTRLAFKRASAPLLLRALREHAGLSSAIVTRQLELAQSGRDPGIDHDAGATLVMLDGPDGRDRLVRGGDGFQLRRAGTKLAMADLEQIASESPERLSANVLLRPVLESQLLASVAYCAGPGELRYLALATAVFQALAIPQPAPVPRWSGLIVDSYADRMVDKFGVTIDELRDPHHDVLARAAADRMPASLSAAFRQLRAVAASEFGLVADEAAAIAAPLRRSATGSQRRVDFEVGRLERRLIRSLKRRHEIEFRQLARARTSVLPVGRPQERTLCVAGPLARHGLPLLGAVRDAAMAHFALALEGPPVPA